MSLLFIKAGMQSSLQDLGRTGFMHQGVAKSGAMDKIALKQANWLVDKPLNSAVIEVSLIGPQIRFAQDIAIAICGAYFDLYLNGNLVFNNEIIWVKKNDLLEFERLLQGARAYLAFSGNLQFPPLLGSYSTNITAKMGGFNGRQFEQNDRLELVSLPLKKENKLSKKHHRYFSGNYLLRCVRSVESAHFCPQQTERFFSKSYTVTAHSNRMGIRLKGESIESSLKKGELTSSGLTEGSIQIPPNGQPIISCADGQTIGGYPRIANIASIDIPLLGQLRPGDKLNFVMISQTIAENLLSQTTVV